MSAAILVVSCGILAWAVIGRMGLWAPTPSGAKSWAETPISLRDSVAPQFRIVTIAGDTVALPKAGRRNLLIAYRTTCGFCQLSQPRWREAFAKICSTAEIALLSSEPVAVQREYWDRHGGIGPSGCGNLVIGRVVDADEFAKQYVIRGTPTHYVTNEAGVVIRTWLGAVTDRASRDSLIAAFR
jgi:hypothetical protein